MKMKDSEHSQSQVWDQSQIEDVLLAHRELCTLSAVDSMYRNVQKRKHFISWLLKVAGLHDRGRLNYINIEVITNRVRIPTLPDELTGLRILQLGNLHLTNQDELLNALYPALEAIEYDICILTGGIGLGLKNDVLMAKRAEQLMKALKGNVYAVLGMGDTTQSMAVMREVGMTVLNNEFETLSLMDRQIEIFGAECSSALIDSRFEDRIHTFNMADLRLFVSSNPQFRVQASRLEFDFMLAGIQSCKHCVYNRNCKWNESARKYPKLTADWQINGLNGYTSQGLGRNDLDVRFRSNPELIIHELVGYRS